MSKRIYVLDTSVLLADPKSMTRFEEHDVVLPVVVVLELESKRNHPELGWSARQALRQLEHWRVKHGNLTTAFSVNDAGGTLRVEINHQNLNALPPSLSGDSNDHRILAVAQNLATEGNDVTVVTKDLPLRLKASIVGLAADEYRNELAHDDSWTGIVELECDSSAIDELFDHGSIDDERARNLPCNTGVVMHAGSQSALARVHSDKSLHLVRRDGQLFDVRGRSAEQRIAIDLLADPSIGIVSLGGPAGTGKSVLALAAGLESVLEQRSHKRVVVFRPLYAVGGQDLGYLPGSEYTFVIIDEAQNLERPVLLTALSRLGEGSRVVLTHDVAQRDNLHVGRHDGIIPVIEALRGHPIFGHVTLTRSERSEIAAVVTELLDGPLDS